MKKLLMTSSIAMLLSLPAYAGDTNMEEVETNLEQAADAAGDAVNETAQDVNQAAENTAEDIEQAIDNTAEDVSEAADAAVEGVENVSSDVLDQISAPDMAIDGYASVDYATMTAEELTGVRIYDTSEDWIGEIDNIIVTADGSVEGAVIGVGGFLGIGEKDVLIDFSRLTLMKEIDGDALRGYVDATKETLEALPAYEAS